MNIKEQFLRFLIVGGFATSIHYLILISLMHTGFTHVIIASSIGFTISAIANYFLNRYFTFRSNVPHIQALPRFLIVALSGLGINATFIFIFHTFGSLYYLIAQLIATIGTLLWNFSLNRLWTFSKVSKQAILDSKVIP